MVRLASRQCAEWCPVLLDLGPCDIKVRNIGVYCYYIGLLLARENWMLGEGVANVSTVAWPALTEYGRSGDGQRGEWTATLPSTGFIQSDGLRHDECRRAEHVPAGRSCLDSLLANHSDSPHWCTAHLLVRPS